MAEAATSASLKQAFTSHQKETVQQIERLEQAFAILGKSPEGNTCEATEGLIAEADEVMSESMPGELLDVALVMAAQKGEHYEIASYGSLATLASGIGQSDIAELLEATLAEETAADEKLTDLAKSEINETAFAAG